jgi:hypothetical protein
MRLFDDLFNFLLRIGELAFAAVVAGLTGVYLHSIEGTSSSDFPKVRFVYTEIVAGFSILLAILWLFPFSGTFIHWPIDFLISVAWFVAFGLLVHFLGSQCGDLFSWSDITQPGGCQRWKADVAFAFLSAIFWLASALLGLWAMRRPNYGTNSFPRRHWYRSHRI